MVMWTCLSIEAATLEVVPGAGLWTVPWKAISKFEEVGSFRVVESNVQAVIISVQRNMSWFDRVRQATMRAALHILSASGSSVGG